MSQECSQGRQGPLRSAGGGVGVWRESEGWSVCECDGGCCGGDGCMEVIVCVCLETCWSEFPSDTREQLLKVLLVQRASRCCHPQTDRQP